MPRNGSGVYSLPAGYEAETGEYATADQHNAPLEDLRDDANAVRPVVVGGTGGNSPSTARAALGAQAQSDVLDNTTASYTTEDKAKLDAIDQGLAIADSPRFAGATLTANLNMFDNDRIQLGGSDDLQLYHDGTHSYIYDSGEGDLRLRTSKFRVMNEANNESIITGDENGHVRLYYDNSQRISTTANGMHVVGEIDGDTVTGAMIASQEEAEDGTNNNHIMTPLRVLQSITHQLTSVWSAINGKANSSHNHSAADITSGVFSSSRLPTSTTSNHGAVRLSTSGENSTGTATGRVPNVAGVQQMIDENPGLGVGQLWTDMSSSRASNLTVYQNTTGQPIQVSVMYNGDFNSAYFEVSSNGSSWVRVYADSGDAAPVPMTGVVIPDQHYYRSSTTGGTTDPDWFELR